jgi:ribosomal subunit interface protein
METPLQVTFRHMEAIEDAERRCREEVAKLERYHGRITGCHVTVSMPHRRHRAGNHFDIRVDLTVPGGEVVVSRQAPAHAEAEDVQAAIREAFDQARRKLEDLVRRRRGSVKEHETPSHGRVKSLGTDYGFIATPDGREVYFHRNSILHSGFDRLAIGSEVRFVEEQGAKGPQASTVRPVGRHHHLGPEV